MTEMRAQPETGNYAAEVDTGIVICAPDGTVLEHHPWCEECGGSGFSGEGTGYGDVCGHCGGQRAT